MSAVEEQNKGQGTTSAAQGRSGGIMCDLQKIAEEADGTLNTPRGNEGAKTTEAFFNLKKLTKKCDPEIRMNTVLHGKDAGRRNTSSVHQAEIPSVTSGFSGLEPLVWGQVE